MHIMNCINKIDLKMVLDLGYWVAIVITEARKL